MKYLLLFLLIIAFSSCHKGGDHEGHNHDHAGKAHHHSDKSHEHKDHLHNHTAYHDGVLNVIGTCEFGHAEVKVAGDLFELWFVGGGDHTNRSVRVTEKEIRLKVVSKGMESAKDIVLNAAPIELAEERIGDCSHFKGKAEWLKDLKHFRGEGNTLFKGKDMKLIIEYPHGFDGEVSTSCGDECEHCKDGD